MKQRRVPVGIVSCAKPYKTVPVKDLLFIFRRRQDVDVNDLKAETDILRDLESAVFNEFRRDVKRKLERQSHRSLFSVNEAMRSSTSTTGKVKKSQSTMRSRVLTRNITKDAIDEVDYGESSEMVNLSPVASHDMIVSPRSWKAPSFESSFHYPTKGTKLQALSPTVQSSGQLSPNSRRKHSSRRENTQPTPESQPSLTSNGSSFSSQRSTTVDQDLDFDLDVMVNIESGKCVFHQTNEAKIDIPESRFVVILISPFFVLT